MFKFTIKEKKSQTKMEESKAQETQVYRIPGFLSQAEIQELHEVAAALVEPASVASRSTLYDETLPESTWLVHYLQTDGHLSAYYPRLMDKLFDALVQANDESSWGLLPSGSAAAPETNRERLNRHGINMRCAEYHTMQARGSLADPMHYDAGSLVTLDIMLANPGVDFDGGCFSTLEKTKEPGSGPGVIQNHGGRFNTGDALLFVSRKCHHVTPVTWGTRQVLVVEFWNGCGCTCPHRCEEPEPGACGLTAANAGAFFVDALFESGLINFGAVAEAIEALRLEGGSDLGDKGEGEGQ